MTKISVLDFGYVDLIESWGSDERIIEAARMSTNKGFQGWGTADTPGDEKLLKYLYEHKHMTPFEMGGMIIEVQAPIFVFREWHRHRTQSYNEMSGRYTILPDLYYTPSIERIMSGKQSNKNKQSSEEGLTELQALGVRTSLEYIYTDSRLTYESLLKQGISREIARLVLPVSQYSRMRASSNLRNWLAFLTLRCASDAQYEIRQYAEIVGNLIAEKFPRTWELFIGK